MSGLRPKCVRFVRYDRVRNVRFAYRQSDGQAKSDEAVSTGSLVMAPRGRLKLFQVPRQRVEVLIRAKAFRGGHKGHAAAI